MLTKSIRPEVLVTSAKEIFETMIFLDLQNSEPSDDHWDSDTLLGTITFTGDIEGCLGICTREDGAKTVAASMLGMDSAEDLSTQDIHDAMGEVCNMVMGCIKASLAADFGDIQVSIPTVICGHQIEYDMGENAEKVRAYVKVADQYQTILSLQWRYAKK